MILTTRLARTAAALTPLLLSFSADDDSRHEHASVTTVKLSAKRDRHRWRDLDGDGRLELIVVTHADRPLAADLPTIVAPFIPSKVSALTDRRVEIFWNGPNGIDNAVCSIFVMPFEARCFALADVLPSPGLELVILDDVGALATPTVKGSIRARGPRHLTRIASQPSFFDFPPEDQLPEWGLALGPESRGGAALILPCAEGFRVWRTRVNINGTTAGSGDNVKKFPELEPGETLLFTPSVEVESSNNRRFAVTKTLPRPILRDVDGDGDLDFVMADLTGARQWIVYAGDSKGRFSTSPVARPAPGLRRELKSDQLTYETAEALDLNNDNVCDLIISRTEGNIGLWDTLTTSQLIYYGRKGPAGFDTRPDQVVSSVGVSMIPRAIDFDGDGRRDLLVSSYRTDLLSNAKNAIFNSARISYFLFIMENGKFPRNATVERNIDVDFKLIEKGGVEPRAYFDGDYDGDHVKDLLSVEEEEHVRAYRGFPRKATFLERGGFEFEKSPMMDINLRATGEIEVVNVNGDGVYKVIMPDHAVIRIVGHKK